MIIAIAGRIDSGKDSIASILISQYGFEKVRFADPLKKMCKIMFDWNDEHIEGKLKEIVDKRWGISPRQAMQCIGNEFSQHLLCEMYPEFKKVTGRRVWSNRLKFGYEANTGVKVVVPDLRYMHEFETIRELGGISIKIVRPGIKINNHESEKYIDKMPCDFTIKNDSSLSVLHGKIEKVCEKIGLKK